MSRRCQRLSRSPGAARQGQREKDEWASWASVESDIIRYHSFVVACHIVSFCVEFRTCRPCTEMEPEVAQNTSTLMTLALIVDSWVWTTQTATCKRWDTGENLKNIYYQDSIDFKSSLLHLDWGIYIEYKVNTDDAWDAKFWGSFVSSFWMPDLFISSIHYIRIYSCDCTSRT